MPGRLGRNFKIIIVLLFVIYLIFGFLTFIFAKKAFASVKKVAGAAKLQDLDATKSYIKDAKGDFQKVRLPLLAFTPIRVIPVIGWYVADSQRGVNAAISGLDAAQTLTEAITPYADVLGLKGQGTFLGGTAQERLAAAINTLSKVTPQLDKVGGDLKDARAQIDQIQSWRYPNFLPGKPGSKLQSAKTVIDQVEVFVVDAKPLIEVLPEIMGQTKEKKYLILLQNDKELRPGGGFITAYAVFKVNKGFMQAETSQDIYQLDSSLTKKVPAPAPILKYLPNVPSLNLRDANLSADYLSSVKQFNELYANSSGPKDIDGIISIDTRFVLDMIKVLGPIDAVGTKFTADNVDACACPQIIYELERYADEPTYFEKGDRKGIIGILMQQLMTKTFNAPKSTWPNIFGTIISSLQKKDVLLYFTDAKSQDAVEKINFAGRIYNYEGDFFHINEANFAGAKSNMYVVEEVTQVVKKGKDGNIDKKVTIDYKYPRKGDNCSLERKGGLCLAGIYRDWIRIYVPKGSTLTKSSGTEVPVTASEDLDKTVFEGFLTIRPEGTAKVELEYTVPLKLSGEYKLLIQKQPGTPGHSYQIDAFGKKQKAFPLEADKELIVKI